MLNGFSACVRGWIRDSHGEEKYTTIPLDAESSCKTAGNTSKSHINLVSLAEEETHYGDMGLDGFCCETGHPDSMQCKPENGEIPTIIAVAAAKRATELFSEFDVPYFLLTSTLLGAIRNNSLVCACSEGKDDVPDVDIGLPYQYRHMLLPDQPLMRALQNLGLRAKYRVEESDTNNVHQSGGPISLFLNNEGSDIGYRYEGWNNFVHLDLSFWFPQPGGDDWANTSLSSEVHYCRKFFETTETTTISIDHWHVNFSIPSRATRLLEAMYGPGWSTPGMNGDVVQINEGGCDTYGAEGLSYR